MIFIKEIRYDRESVKNYAIKWATSRNPKYYDFENIGGDCTAFASQCIYEGSKIMNYDKVKGWYYINGNSKSPSWTGVEFLYNFLVNNNGIGPFGRKVEKEKIEIGDITQLSFDGIKYSHSLVIIDIIKPITLSNIYIAAHTYDVVGKQISKYSFQKIRFIHIDGVRI